MKLNVSSPEHGKVVTVDIDDEKLLLPFYEKRIGAEVPADTLGDQWKGYVLRVTGGNDKQGFPMMQGVLTNHRVRLLLRKGMPCFRERRKGAARRKSVRGCIVASDLSALNLTIAKKGDNVIENLTDEVRPRRLGPKRAGKIRKMFGLEKGDDVRPFVVRRVIREGKTKAPKIQRLVTAQRIQRKKAKKTAMANQRAASKQAAAEYQKVLADYIEEKKKAKLASAAAKKAVTAN
ncbi:40S ribosomal protein S6 [Gregarina niphandrodes]|uniref:40S ribosomal protein S6 n=1 Tax=Gregarina niphandrodes TaxID=110365 RepID=A0A023B5J8_GRENI|nr:40S ribosomal protein S6 [Gregarina niphandrodes]EZG61134.1 40S ribosomal protein S6 [Gregarina niphandrodes]|eukprot:XP_011130787.1 40S ribosomal protein S6 [Gregarina niphandrodes]